MIKGSQPNTNWVIQKYLEKPLLYKNRKIDIRVWVLMNQKGDIYWFKNPYVRTSSADYSLEDANDMLTHLTNNCFQKKSDQYGVHEEGNILDMENFESWVQENIFPGYNLKDHLYPWIKSCIIDTF